ncbi:hypothetical protein GGR52DRAFT_536440 [Hypoxylon sp. FL1284]|nr:hypothetical protein GGR52DRAFT_536440 [Hypoxylon sp. FL1284]
MDKNQYLVGQCISEKCDAIVLLGGPYCEKHMLAEGFSMPPTTNRPSSGQGQPNNGQASYPSPSQPSRVSIGMDPPEKTGDAITVKTPLAVFKPASEKKQLPDKKVARKTTSAGSSRHIAAIPASHRPDPRPPASYSSSGNAPSLDRRPQKRPRLSAEPVVQDPGGRHEVHSPKDNTMRVSPQVKSADTPERDREITVTSDFTLHPRKANSASLEMPRKHGEQRPAKPTTKLPNKDRPRKLPFPADNVIDLTGDDSQSEPRRHEDLHPNGQKGRDNPSSNAYTRPPENTPRLRQEENSTKVQPSTNKISQVDETTLPLAGNEPDNARKITPNSTSLPPPPKLSPVNIAPRPNPTVLLSNKGSPQPTLTHEKQKAPQYWPPYTAMPADPSRQNGKQIRQDSGSNVADVAEITKITNHIAANRRPAFVATPSISMPRNLSPDKSRPRSSEAEKLIALQFPKAQVQAYIHEVVNKPPVVSTPVISSLPGGRVIETETILPRADSSEKSTLTGRPQRKELDIPELPNVRDQHQSDAHSSVHNHIVQKPAQPSPQALQHPGELAGTETTSITAEDKPLMSLKTKWKHMNPEQRREAIVSQHDPKKFDSYIYGKLNEPNRPGSALFDVPEHLQPPRPTRPATHFAHFDPRVHWSHRRSKKWHLKKQDEIRERGTRKSNFGRAAASAARQRQQAYEDSTTVVLPERVSSNPKWVAAVYELDDMAEQYHAQRRERTRHFGAEQRERRNERSTIDDSNDEMRDISP